MTYTPVCCGQNAKWVEQSVNLKYWYCTKCKNEVIEKPLSAMRIMGEEVFSDNMSVPPRLLPNPPLPAIPNAHGYRSMMSFVQGKIEDLYDKYGKYPTTGYISVTDFYKLCNELGIPTKPYVEYPAAKEMGRRILVYSASYLASGAFNFLL